MISASTAAKLLLTETLLQLVHKYLDELSQKEHQLFFRTAWMMKNGLDQTCAVNGFSYSAPHCIKIWLSSTVGLTCLSSVWFYTYIKIQLMTSSIETLQKLKMKIIIWSFFQFIPCSSYLCLEKKGVLMHTFIQWVNLSTIKEMRAIVPNSACLFLYSCHT